MILNEQHKLPESWSLNLECLLSGPVQYERDSSQVFLGRDYGSTRISGEVANEIDKAVREIIESCLETARNCILQNKDMLILIAETLLKYETITAKKLITSLNTVL